MIPVRLEKETGKYMLIHGYTGVVDIVSESVSTDRTTDIKNYPYFCVMYLLIP